MTDLHPEYTDVSVIMPAYQSADTIERALLSVSEQTLKPREVIIVDDGSEDHTFDVANRYRDKMNGVALNVFRQNNSGAGAARNKAITHANCEFVAFLDSDDEWLPTKISVSIDHIKRDDLDLISHNVWIVEDQSETYMDITSRFQAAYNKLYHGLYRRGFISTSTVVAKRAAILEVGGFDENLRTSQDFDLWLKLLNLADARFGSIDAALTRYHVRPHSNTRQTDQRLINTLEIAYRYISALKTHPGSALTSLWFRIIAVHVEAIRANFKNGKVFSGFRAILLIPCRLILGTLILVFKS